MVAGIDEVGRGALAGPVSVGIVVIRPSVGEIPLGLTDSKLLKAPAREALLPLIREWCVASAVGHASAQEIDALGIIAALRLACIRALATLPVAPDAVILDGSHDWLTQADDLFAEADPIATPPVHTRVKADLTCASVSAASIAAKVERDALMRALDAAYPGYAFAAHKGYGSESHRDAIRTMGATDVHRRTWKLL